MLAAFFLNWLEVTILLLVWMALVVDGSRQPWISRYGKIVWIALIIFVPVVSWIAYGCRGPVSVQRTGVGARQLS